MGNSILNAPAPRADLRLRYGPDPSHFGDLRLPPGAGPHPIVIVIHGGFWRAAYDLTHSGPLCAALTAAGAVTWNIEYRRLGQPGGGWPGTFLDVAMAADYLRELAPQQRLDLERVVAVGHSAGGHLALWLAARGRIPPGDALYTPAPLPLRAVISLAGVADLRQAWALRLSNGVVETLMGGAPDRCPACYATASPAEMIPLGVPQVLIHGTSDQNVPYAISRDYHAAATNAGDDAQLIMLPDTGHFEVINPLSHAWPTVRKAVLVLLQSR